MYAITDAGREAAREWLREMLRTTGGEYPEFIAAVSILFGLAPDDARAQLELRAESLAAELAETEAQLEGNPGLPRLFLLEEEYRQAAPAGRARLAARRDRRPERRAPDLERGVAPGDRHRVPAARRRQGGTAMTATIEAHGLEKRYRKTRALDGLDLVAERAR